jgi:hypothetical protein
MSENGVKILGEVNTSGSVRARKDEVIFACNQPRIITANSQRAIASVIFFMLCFMSIMWNTDTGVWDHFVQYTIVIHKTKMYFLFMLSKLWQVHPSKSGWAAGSSQSCRYSGKYWVCICDRRWIRQEAVLRERAVLMDSGY